jgi:hypothetical protein
MNRTVLYRHPSRVPPKEAQVARMNRFFGSDIWKGEAYREDTDLFGHTEPEKKPGNEPVVQCYCKRLREVAGFKYVSSALAMRNASNVVVYYLIGASQVPQGLTVFKSVFKKWEKRGVRIVAAEHDRVD